VKALGIGIAMQNMSAVITAIADRVQETFDVFNLQTTINERQKNAVAISKIKKARMLKA
jgi:hypothetical protein